MQKFTILRQEIDLDTPVLEIGEEKYVKFDKVKEMSLSFIQKLISEGKLLVAPGYEEYFKSLLDPILK